jgi:hypothetical protein
VTRRYPLGGCGGGRDRGERITLHLRLHALRIGGVLLVALGVLHLAVTPVIGQLLQRAALPSQVGWLKPPMLLNHILVGVLLLPLGVLAIYAAPHAANGHPWAKMVTRTTALAIATLPPTLFWLMGTRYFSAVPFRVAAGIVCLGSVVLLVAAFWPVRARVGER